MKLQSNFTPKDSLAVHDTSRCWLLICWSGKQQEIAIRIFDDEIFAAPRLLFQCLMKGNASRLKFKKQQLDLVGCGDGPAHEKANMVAGCAPVIVPAGWHNRGNEARVSRGPNRDSEYGGKAPR